MTMETSFQLQLLYTSIHFYTPGNLVFFILPKTSLLYPKEVKEKMVCFCVCKLDIKEFYFAATYCELNILNSSLNFMAQQLHARWN